MSPAALLLLGAIGAPLPMTNPRTAGSTETGTSFFGALAPGPFDRAVIALTSCLPDNWLGLRFAIVLRRLVTMRLAYPDGALDVVRWGLRLRLHPRDNGCEKNLLFTPQMYEPAERVELAAEIDRAKDSPFVFVDIGANVGLFSFFVAARADRNARILAVEPDPENLSRLAFNIRINPGVPIRVASVALGDRVGKAALEVDRRDRGGTRIVKSAGRDAPTVDTQTLLQLLQRVGIDAIDAIKIDVEGAEDVVLAPFFRDAPKSMWPRLILLEDARSAWTIDLFSLLASLGYIVVSRTRLNVMLRLGG
jgi:FkbM family methyltransferase